MAFGHLNVDEILFGMVITFIIRSIYYKIEPSYPGTKLAFSRSNLHSQSHLRLTPLKVLSYHAEITPWQRTLQISLQKPGMAA